MLTEDHYEEAKAQMDRERNNSLSAKDDEEFPGLVTWATMKRQDIGVLHREVVTYLKEHHDAATGMCLGWIVRDSIYAPEWEDKLNLDTQQRQGRPKFFNFAATDELTTEMALIVPRDKGNASCREAVYRERYESGEKRLYRTPQFLAADAIVWNVCKHVFKGSLCEVHFKTSTKKVLGPHGNFQRVPPSGRAVLRLIEGQYMGKAAAKERVKDAVEQLRAMRYTGESRNWNFQKHIHKTLDLRTQYDFYAPGAEVAPMSDYDLTTYFLDSIPADCPITALVTRKDVIEGDRESYSSFSVNVLPYLSGAIKVASRDDTKRRVASASTQRDNKRPRSNRGHTGGGGSPASRRSGGRKQGWGSLKLTNGKVTGKVEGLHYPTECWAKMSAEQRSECLRLRKDKKKSSTAAAVNSETEKLVRRVASLESEIKEKSRDRRSSSRGRRSRSRSDSRDRHSSSSRRRSRDNDRHDKYPSSSGRRSH